jgi:Heat induced stress protein YflT domain
LQNNKHNQNSAVAIYNTHTDAQAAVNELQTSGIDMKLISIVGKDYRTDDHVVGYYKTDNRLKYWGKLGAFWGGIWSLLVGEAFFWMPGVGPILVGGSLVSTIVGALEGATIHNGLTALGSALHSMGIPKSDVINYESALRANKFLLIVHGTDGETSRANDILRTTETIELAAHKTTEAIAS